VDVGAITERHLISQLKNAAFLLLDVVTEWGPNKPAEVDWARMRSLEFQDALRTKGSIEKQLQAFACPFQEGFDDKARAFFFLFVVDITCGFL
jgi:antiviral helicase SKI2